MPRHIDDELLGLLTAGGSWTGAALAQQLGVSLRTVRRGLARLAQDGVQLQASTGRGGGVALVRGPGLPRLRLGHREVLQTLLALAVAESVGAPLLGASVRPVRHKLAAAFPVEQRHALGRLRARIRIGAAESKAVAESWGAPGQACMALLQDGFFEQRRVKFAYQDAQGRSSQREVEPQFLLLNHPVWYLLAYDCERQAGRCFRLDRIRRLGVLDTPFSARPARVLMAEVEQYFGQL